MKNNIDFNEKLVYNILRISLNIPQCSGIFYLEILPSG